MVKTMTVTMLLLHLFLLSAQTPDTRAESQPKYNAFRQTGQEVDGFFERARSKISYSWFKCREHFSLMFTAVGDKSKYGEQDLKARARLKTEEFSEQAVQFGQEVREKAVEFGRDTRKKGEKFYQQKSDEIADDIEEKTKRIQEELRNTGSEIYKDTSKRFNSAADDAAKEILDQ